MLIKDASRPNHKSYRKFDTNEYVQNSLCCNMGMIILDLYGNMEAVRGQKRYSECTLWHLKPTFGSSHSASSAYQEMRSVITFSLHISNSRTKPAGLDF